MSQLWHELLGGEPEVGSVADLEALARGLVRAEVHLVHEPAVIRAVDFLVFAAEQAATEQGRQSEEQGLGAWTHGPLRVGCGPIVGRDGARVCARLAVGSLEWAAQELHSEATG